MRAWDFLRFSEIRPTSNGCNFLTTEPIPKFLVSRISSLSWNVQKWHLSPELLDPTHPSGSKREADFRKIRKLESGRLAPPQCKLTNGHWCFHGCRRVSPLLINHSYNPRERDLYVFMGTGRLLRLVFAKPFLLRVRIVPDVLTIVGTRVCHSQK